MSTETGRFAYTPSRKLDKGNEQEMSTEAKRRSPDVAESHYQNQKSKQTLDAIQSRIKEIGEQLRQLNNKMVLETDKLSNQYIEMENSRKDLKKQLLELDYEHKLMCTVQMRESKMANEQKMKEIRKQYEEKFSKIKQSSSKPQKNQEEQKLADSRRKLRMAEIEVELEQSKLRRSRMERLNEQLGYLRLTYTDPLLWRSYLSWPSYYYYPYYSSYYRPYYSSYYSSYYRPYYSSYYSPYSQYLYPYSYKWWLY